MIHLRFLRYDLPEIFGYDSLEIFGYDSLEIYEI